MILIVAMLYVLAVLSSYTFDTYAAEVKNSKTRIQDMDTKDVVELVYLDEKANSPYAAYARQTMNEIEQYNEEQRIKEAKAARKKFLKDRKARKLREKKLKEKREKEKAAKIAKENTEKTSVQSETGSGSTNKVGKWNGQSLSPSAGAINGPSGRETYYNLNMSGVISIMRGMGFSEKEYPYAVRSDGVKTLGGYVMVAANLSIRPKGTLIETSLGTGIVVDTGGFAAHNKTQLDIATAW